MEKKQSSMCYILNIHPKSVKDLALSTDKAYRHLKLYLSSRVTKKDTRINLFENFMTEQVKISLLS